MPGARYGVEYVTNASEETEDRSLCAYVPGRESLGSMEFEPVLSSRESLVALPCESRVTCRKDGSKLSGESPSPGGAFSVGCGLVVLGLDDSGLLAAITPSFSRPTMVVVSRRFPSTLRAYRCPKWKTG